MAQVQVQAQAQAQLPGSYADSALERANYASQANGSPYFGRQPGNRQQEEDASEVLVFVLTGGPKWGFRIKQLNDNRVIVSRVDRGPAERSGLRVYDELLSVNNVQLLNSPRSLLLHDHPEQFGAAALNNSSPGDKTPLLAQPADTTRLAEQSASPTQFAAAAAAAAATTGIELSKLDFAYQLIKHSSASNNNKLVLSVRRFLDPAYARASALAASNMLTAWNFSSSRQYRPSLADLVAPHDEWPLQLGQAAPPGGAIKFGPLSLARVGQPHDDRQSRAPMGRDAAGASKRSQPSSGTNVYKCCDCYCDKGGK